MQVHGLELKDPIAEQLRSDADTELQEPMLTALGPLGPLGVLELA